MGKKITPFILLFLVGCTVVPIIDHWKNLPNTEWHKKNVIKIPVQLRDTDYYYNLYINVRVTNDYKYTNLWLKLKTKKPGGDTTTQPIMLTLADHKGQWAGHNLGHIVSFQIPVHKNMVFNKSGNYLFSIEPNMRDTLIYELVSIGLKLDKQQKILK